MKFRKHGAADKIEVPMAPMIDVVFQLLIFFMLTLKIVEPEGDFSINMPLAAQAQAPDPNKPLLPDLKVRMTADENGRLASLQLNRRNLGNDARAFERLNNEILKVIGGRPGNPLFEHIEVEIDADYNLNYGYVIQAVAAVRGRYDPKTDQIVSYVEKIKFAPPRRPSGVE